MRSTRQRWFLIVLCGSALVLPPSAVCRADLLATPPSQSNTVLVSDTTAPATVVRGGATLPTRVNPHSHNRRIVTPAPVTPTAASVQPKTAAVQYVRPIVVPVAKANASAETLPLAQPDSTLSDQQREIIREEIRALLDQNSKNSKTSMNSTARGNGFNAEVIERGREAFGSSCTQCHEAERALSKSKSRAAWLSTIRRMAAKDDADIAAGDFESIATYLASRSEPADSDAAKAGDSATGIGGDSVSLFGTISTVWRGTDDTVENKGFFPDVWIGAEWQPSGPVSGRVMACTSCHGQSQGLGVELVEANISLDLMHLLTDCKPEERDECALDARVKAGRFVVPFGAFAAKSHPGVYRTVSNPLMFNMGRRVGSIDLLQPVIPMPYADEGVNVSLKKPIWGDLTATFDAYAVNGLQTGGPEVFLSSRSYRDNNSNLAVGGRGTIGNRYFKIGGSLMSGELQADGSPLQNYRLFGGDVTARYEDFVRAYFEYAVRREDPFFGFEGTAKGTVVEGEVRIWNEPRIGLLARYDTLQHSGVLGTDSIYRFTSGVNVTLPGGSLLLINHERWVFTDRHDVNILGLRWTATF